MFPIVFLIPPLRVLPCPASALCQTPAPFRPKEEGADHVRLEFPLAGVARKTLHLKVAGIFHFHDSGAVLRMVSTNNLNRDVLELVFSHLNADDLCYVALVNHSFFAAATPRLYRTLFFRQKHANKFPVRHYSPRLHCLSSDFWWFKLSSPFAVILARPSYSVHVRAMGEKLNTGSSTSQSPLTMK